MQCKVLIFVVLLALIKHVSLAEIEASPNTSVTFPCNVSLNEDQRDVSLMGIKWISNGSDVASFEETAQTIQDGFSWNNASFINGDFSITLLKASLDLQGMYKCTVSYNSSSIHSSNVTFGIIAPPSLTVPQRWVVLGKGAQFECFASGYYPSPISFSWTRNGKEIKPLYQVEGVMTPDGYYTAVGNLAYHPSQEDRNATFACKVLHSGSYQEQDFQLNITFLPTVKLSAMTSASNKAPLTLYCDVERFYPETVSVSWFQNGTALPDPPAVDKNPDGTYKTRHYFTLSPEQRQQRGQVECAVTQPGVENPVNVSEDLDKLDAQNETTVLNKSAKALVAMMCISIVLVFLLCFGFSWRKRDEKQKSLTVSGIILPPRVIVGQKGRVSISIEGRRVDRVQTVWFLNDTPIADTSLTGTSRSNFNCLYSPLTTIHLPYGLTLTSPASEKGPLLTSRGKMGYYKLHTQGPLHSSRSGTQQLISALTFIPQISLHKGAMFKCQVSYIGKDKIVQERVSEKFTLLSPPEVSEIQLTETQNDSDVINMTVSASHFHPDVITFRWFCQGGELTPVASEASSSPRPNSEGLFSAYSQCKLPRGELEKGSTKVWVKVHHIALKHPITRESRGFIKRPCISEIVSSDVSSNQTLGCEITDFYPPNISVTWLRLRGGEEDDREEELIDGGELWGPIQSQSRRFRATASLERRLIHQEKKERRGGIVCRVDHCSLPEPIEKHWKYGGNVPPHIPSSISVCWSGEGVGVFSILLKGGHPKPELLWTAGGPTFLPLVSSETVEIGDEGMRELKSVCALERSTTLSNPANRQLKKRKKEHQIKTKAAVTDPDTKGIEYIDEGVDEETYDKDEETISEEDEESCSEKEEDQTALHINRVNLMKDTKENKRVQLRVCLEITHPALKLPVYRTWTEPNEEISPSA